MRIIAVDPSLTDTGIAELLHNPDQLVNGEPVLRWRVHRVQTRAVAGYPLTRERLLSIRAQVLNWLDWEQPASAVILERPALSRQSGMAHDRAGLWWFLYDGLAMRYGAGSVLTPEPNLRAKYVTGKGNAGKDEVMAAVIRRYPSAPVSNNNEADAVAWAAIGARLLGSPIETSLPAKNLEALRTLRFPVEE